MYFSTMDYLGMGIGQGVRSFCIPGLQFFGWHAGSTSRPTSSFGSCRLGGTGSWPVFDLLNCLSPLGPTFTLFFHLRVPLWPWWGRVLHSSIYIWLVVRNHRDVFCLPVNSSRDSVLVAIETVLGSACIDCCLASEEALRITMATIADTNWSDSLLDRWSSSGSCWPSLAFCHPKSSPLDSLSCASQSPRSFPLKCIETAASLLQGSFEYYSCH
jgi:hypothetical protein